MADVDIDVQAAQAACSSWNDANVKFSGGPYATMGGNPFNALTSPENIASSYLNEVVKSMDEILTFSTSCYNTAYTYVSGMSRDGIDPPPDPVPIPGGGGGGGGGGGESSAPPSSPVKPPDGKTIDLSSLEKSSLTEIDGITQILRDMSDKAGKGIDELLLDEKYADELKKLLLASAYVPEELKKILIDSDSQVIRETFKDMMNGNQPEIFDLNSLNLNIVYSHLIDVANKNGITVEQLLNDPKYASLLKDSLKEYKNIVGLFKGWADLSGSDCQSKLFEVFDGAVSSDVTNDTVSFVRNYIDVVAGETDIAAESLLTESKYADVLKQGVDELGKTCVFFESTTHSTENGMQGTISNLFSGKNYKAFGMNDTDVTNFKSEIDSLAKSNGVTSDKLLTDSAYSEKVMNTLASSQNANNIGFVFKNSAPSVSQNVAKNLYNTTLDIVNTTKSS